MSDEKLHATLGASTAHRWMACPGSVRLSEGQPNYSSKFADEGTAAHWVAAECLHGSNEPWEYAGMVAEGVEVTEEMVDAVLVYVNYCRVARGQHGGQRVGVQPRYWVEHQFSLEDLSPPEEMFGTADFVVYYASSSVLEIVDLKYGKGVVVEVKNNKQLRYYALGALLSLKKSLPSMRYVSTVKITIVQPRVAHVDGPIRSEELSVAELIDFSTDLLEAARKTQEPNAPLVVGSHCRFCPALAVCPAQRDNAQALAQIEFAELPTIGPPNPETMPIEVLADVLHKAHILEDWLGAGRARMQRALENGEVTEERVGFKLVARRATRRWVDEEKAVTWLAYRGYDTDDVYERKFRSPAQIEKLLGKAKKELPAEFIEKKSSGYTMAPTHDVRPAIELRPGDEFLALESGEPNGKENEES